MLAGNIPATGPLKEYNDWRTGVKTVTYTRTADSKTGGFNVVGVDAFAFSDAALQKILTTISKRADDQKDTVLGTTGAGALQLKTTLDNYIDRYGFIPAKAIVFVPDATQADTLKPSEITGVRYNPREGKSYTYPFGRSSATDGEADRAAAIQSALITAGSRSVSFTPERVRI